MKRFWIILWIFALLVPVMAQEDSASAAFERLLPSNVRLRLDKETGIASLVFNASPAVCEPLVTDVTVEGNVIDVDAYVPLSAQGVTCNYIAPYEPVIELGELEPDTSYVIFLNDFASTFFLPQSEGTIMDMPSAAVWGEDNALLGYTRVDSIIDTVHITDADDVVTITVEGSHPDGCETEVYSWLRQDDVDSNIYHLEVFRLLPEGVMCPAMLQDFGLTVNTKLAADGNYMLETGDKWFSYTPEVVTSLITTPLTIDSVIITPDDNQHKVTIFGSLVDCGVDLTQAQSATDYASFINLGYFFPLDNSCSDASNPYEGQFTVDVLPVIVNGIAYDENGILPVNAQSIGRPDSSVGGDTMPVDTVIEAVDVLILESFPMQLDLAVTGYQPDGCDFPVLVEQSREGNVVTVHVYREVPSDVMCTMMIVPYEATIRLDGGFESGSYEIHVNDFVTNVDL